MKCRLLAPCVCLLVSLTAIADDYEAAAIARRMIDGYMRDIREASKNVEDAVGPAVSGKVGELDKWAELARQADRYEQTFTGCIPILDQQVRSLVRAAPGSSLPAFDVPDPFGTYVGRAQTRIAEIERAQKEVDQKIALVDQQIAKFRGAIGEATRQAYAETVEGFLPSEQQLLGEAGVVVFGAYFGPPGIIAAGIAAGAAAVFNQYVNTYQTAKALADQGKAFTGMIEVLQQKRAQMVEARTSYQPALSEMRQILQTLETYDRKFQALRDQLASTVEGWRGLAGEAAKDLTEKARQEYEEARRKEQPPVPVGSRYYYSSTPIAPITSDEYVGEADGLLGAVRSAAQAAMDGGDPQAVEDAYLNGNDTAFDRCRQASEALAAAREVLAEAQRQYSQVLCPPIYRRYYDMLPVRCWACEASKPGLRAANEAKSRAAAEYLSSALESAGAGVRAQAQAVAQAHRESARRGLVLQSYWSGGNMLRGMVYSRAELLRGQFEHEYQSWSRQADLARTAYGEACRDMPAGYELSGWQDYVDRLNADVAGALGGGQAPKQLLADLNDQVARVESMQERATRGRPVVEQTLTELNQLVAQAHSEMTAFLDKYEKMLAMNSWWDVDNRRRAVDMYFAETESPPQPNTDYGNWLAALRRAIDFAREMDEWMEFYEGRLAVAVHRIDGKVGPALNIGLYGQMPPVKELFATGDWSGVRAAIDRAVPADYRVRGQTRIGNWAELTPREQLSAAVQSGQAVVQRVLDDYLKTRRNGMFARVRTPADLVAVKQYWDGLQAVIVQFDGKAGALNQQASTLSDAVTEHAEPVTAAYEKMPASLQRQLQYRHSRFVRAVYELQAFLGRYRGNLQPLGATQSGGATATTLLSEYERDLAAAIERERRQQEEAERRQREYEEAQRKKREAEEAARQAQQAAGDAVRAFYDRFAQNYQRRNAAGVVALLDDDWQAADGSTIADLEETLVNSFRVFDEVQCTINGLNIQPGPAPDQLRVEYQIKIVGRINRNRIKHEEDSRVVEIVRVNGRDVRILRTLDGRFWTTN